MTSSPPITIDASLFMGTRAILRTSLILSAITKQPVRIIRIAEDQLFPGLSKAELLLIDVFTEATKAQTQGAGVGSTTLIFTPTQIFSLRKTTIELQGASATSVLLSSFVLPILFSLKKCKYTFIGGTHVKNAPTITAIKEIFFRYLRFYAQEINLSLPQIGFYPKGGGRVQCTIYGRSEIEFLRPLHIKDYTSLVVIKGELVANKTFAKEESLERLKELIRLPLRSLGVPVLIETRYANSLSEGISCDLRGFFGNEEGYDNDLPLIKGINRLWDAPFDAEKDLASFVQSFSAILASPGLDPFIADQLIPLIALLGGSFRVQDVTEELQATMMVAEQILGVSFVLEGSLLRCKGYFPTQHEKLPSIDEL